MNDVELPNRSVQGPSHRPIVHAIGFGTFCLAMLALVGLLIFWPYL